MLRPPPLLPPEKVDLPPLLPLPPPSLPPLALPLSLRAADLTVRRARLVVTLVFWIVAEGEAAGSVTTMDVKLLALTTLLAVTAYTPACSGESVISLCAPHLWVVFNLQLDL